MRIGDRNSGTSDDGVFLVLTYRSTAMALATFCRSSLHFVLAISIILSNPHFRFNADASSGTPVSH
jgi:hypothetical protein